jgi:transcription termination/antitermination protein NusG
MSFKWYVVQAYSGSEKFVEKSIIQRAEKANLGNLIKEILIPTKKVIQVRKGKKVEIEKNFYPGYVLIHVEMTDSLWHLIRQIPKVSGFISQESKPVTISKAEVESIISQIENDEVSLVQEVEFDIGEAVKVIDGGPFDGFTGTIESIDSDKKKLVVSVSIFGRPTPVNLGYDQVEKI